MNAHSPIVLTDPETSTSIVFMFHANAPNEMLVTEFAWMYTFVTPSQCANASMPISLTDCGIVSFFSLLQHEHAPSPIAVTVTPP